MERGSTRSTGTPVDSRRSGSPAVSAQPSLEQGERPSLLTTPPAAPAGLRPKDEAVFAPPGQPPSLDQSPAPLPGVLPPSQAEHPSLGAPPPIESPPPPLYASSAGSATGEEKWNSGDRGSVDGDAQGKNLMKRANTAGVLLKQHTMPLVIRTTSQQNWLTRVEDFVHDPWFEPGFVGLIFLNALVMAVEMQYQGIDKGFRMGYPEAVLPADQTWPGAQFIFDAVEWVFGIIFCFELLLKSIALRFAFIKDLWSWLDIVCVALWLVGQLATSLSTGVDPGLFRLFRLARLMRLLRLVRTLQGCEALYLMFASVKASVLALTWSAVLIFLIQMSIALVLNEFLKNFLESEQNDIEVRHRVFRYFGTFSKAFLTMFEFMLANWPPSSRVLTEDVSEFLVLFIFLYQCVIGFAVVKVIMGVFLQVTFNVAGTDDTIMISQKERAIKNHTKKISRLFLAADQDGNGTLDKEEFRDMLADNTVRQWLASMDCDVSLFASDPDTLFTLVSGDTGSLNAEMLVKGVARMQGVARSIDLAVFADQNREIREIMEQVSQDLLEMGGGIAFHAPGDRPEAVLEGSEGASDSPAEDLPPSRPPDRKRVSVLSHHSSSLGTARLKHRLPTNESLSKVSRSSKSSDAGAAAGRLRPGMSFTSERSRVSKFSRRSMGETIDERRGSSPPDDRRGSQQTLQTDDRRGSQQTLGSTDFRRGSQMTRKTASGDLRGYGKSEADLRRTAISEGIFRSGTARVSVFDSDLRHRTSCSDIGRFFKTIARSPRFEAFFGALIFVNTLVMATEAQYQGIDLGHRLGYPGESRPAKEVWPWASLGFQVCDLFFLSLFSLEVILKLLGLCCKFFYDPWNYFDMAVVCCGIAETVAAGTLPVSPGVLRFARLMRLLRMLKLVRAMKEFDSLHLMITSIKGSLQALLWSSALMFVVQMLIGLVLNATLENYLLDTHMPIEDRRLIYGYFGKFTKAMLTMFEITLANWIPCARALTEKVSEFYVLFSLAHKFVIGFAVIMVITGVFLNETFRVAASDDHIMITQKQRQIITHTKKMSALFEAADEDGSGTLEREEFVEMMDEPSVKTWLSSMGLDVSDADALFTMVSKSANDPTKIEAKELVTSLAHLKGNAKSLDMHVVNKENRASLKLATNVIQQWRELRPIMGEDLRGTGDEPAGE